MPCRDEVLQYLPWVRTVVRWEARKLSHRVDRADLVQDGMIGAIQALRSWEGARGVPLRAWVRMKIRWAVREGIRRQDRVRRWTRKKVREGEWPPPVWLPIESVDLASEGEEGPQAVWKEQRAVRVRDALSRLAPREQAVVWGRYGEERSWGSIAGEWGVSEARACQIAKRALAKMRRPLREVGVVE